MAIKEYFLGYCVFLVVFLLLLVLLTQLNISPLLRVVPPIFAILASIKFIHSMSAKTLGLVVLLFTTVLPVLFLIMIDSNSQELLISYIDFIFLLQLFLPTSITIIMVMFIQSRKLKDK